jgi:hypothetical protein
MAVVGLARLTTGPAGTGDMLTWHAARAAPVKDAIPWGERD